MPLHSGMCRCTAILTYAVFHICMLASGYAFIDSSAYATYALCVGMFGCASCTADIAIGIASVVIFVRRETYERCSALVALEVTSVIILVLTRCVRITP